MDWQGKFINKVINGDSLKLLKEIPDRSVDMVFTDPPYMISSNVTIKRQRNPSKHGKVGSKVWSDYKDKQTSMNVALGARQWLRKKEGKTDWKYKGKDIEYQFGQWDVFDSLDDYLNFTFTWFGECARILKKGGHLVCVDSETECLTKTGWKNYEKLKLGELVLTYNMEKDYTEFQPIEEIFVNDYSSDMYHIKNRELDMMLTPEHRCIVSHKNKKTKWVKKIVTANELSKSMKILVSSNYNSGSVMEQNISNDLLKLIAWILTEGHIRYYNNEIWNITIGQSVKNQCFVDEIETILENLKFPFHKYVQKKIGYADCIVFVLNKKVSQKLEKFLSSLWDLLNLPINQLHILYDTLMKGDGSKSGKCFTQCNKEFLGFFQALLVLIGKRGTTDNKKYCTITKRKWIGIRNLFGKVVRKKIKYDGKVWCIKTNNKTFVARRGGRVFFTGNSFFDKHKLTYMVNMGEELGFKSRQPLFWIKQNPVPQARKVAFMSSVEMMYWGTKETTKRKYATFNYECGQHTDYIMVPICSGKERYKEGFHPTQKPLKVLRWILLYLSNTDDIIVDPFAGSGSTAVASKELNRRFVGIEIDEKYYRLAERRLRGSSRIIQLI